MTIKCHQSDNQVATKVDFLLNIAVIGNLFSLFQDHNPQ